MKLISTYSVKLKEYRHIFKDTIRVYRAAVDFFLMVCDQEWEKVSDISTSKFQMTFIEQLTHKTAKNPATKYDFDAVFYKFPSYLRRAAIYETLGKYFSYRSNLANWERDPQGRKPSFPKAGYVYPCLYRDGMYERTDIYTARIKVYIRNTWDWIDIKLRKSDVDYIQRHCSHRKECAPTLQKRGKEWFLDFPFEEQVTLNNTPSKEQVIAAVDLGINSAATVSVMRADGTVLGRHFCRFPREKDSLTHAVNRIKKAQQHGARKTPRLWARANGINDDIAVKTAKFIIDVAVLYNADVIVFEHLDLKGRKRGSKKQRLHLWKARRVQSIVTDQAHRLGMRVSHVNAWNTSRLAFDGSGRVLRGRQSEKTGGSYSVCEFQNGKVYNCDLNATYNIGARYFIRTLLKSLPATERLAMEAKVPACAKRSTCTLSTLISLHAALAA